MGSASSTDKAKTLSQDLRGKHFVVTGANSGIGFATTRELAKLGAKVTLACRNAERGQQAVAKMKVEALAKPVEEVRIRDQLPKLLVSSARLNTRDIQQQWLFRTSTVDTTRTMRAATK